MAVLNMDTCNEAMAVMHDLVSKLLKGMFGFTIYLFRAA